MSRARLLEFGVGKWGGVIMPVWEPERHPCSREALFGKFGMGFTSDIAWSPTESYRTQI